MSQKFAAVAGSPIEHSLSPAIHKAGYAALKMDWDYKKFELDASSFPDFIKNRDPNLVGMSLTMPLKEVAIEVADVVTELAKKVNSANTLLFKDGKIFAGNTDIYGIVTALQTNKQLDISNPSIIGSGATARSAVAALHQLGAQKVILCARNEQSLTDLKNVAQDFGLEVSEVQWSQIHKALAATTVISSLPSGAMDSFAAMGPEIPGSLLDVAYSPWPSKIALEWILRRGFVVSGLEMLLHQAARQFELMTGKKAPLKQMREAIF
ncbi:MAG: shikimate dehydrogenase [Actinomycetes bacterium]